MTTQRHLTDQQLQQVYKAFTFSNATPFQIRLTARTYLSTALMADAGLRLAECAALTINDLYWQQAPRPILIVRAEIAKTGATREIPLSPTITHAATLYYQASALITFPLDSTLFPSLWRTHQPSSPRQLSRAIENHCNRAIGIHVHPHMLRHTFAQRLRLRTDLPTLQQLLGHARLSSTQIYTVPGLADKQAAIAAMARPHDPSSA